MSEPDRALVAALRAELAAIDPPRRCCRRAELAGLAGAIGLRRRSVARLAFRLARGDRRTALAGIAIEAASAEAAAAREASPAGAAAADGQPASAGFDWHTAPEHCRVAYLRGTFLARGSLSVASSRTHLEFVVPLAEAPVLSARLADVGLRASWRVRRGRGVVTWKSAETVGTFLRLVGAGASLLELESRQVSRAVRGDLNRVINAESANLHRSVAAAALQLQAIDEIEADGRLARQPYVVRLVAQARRETPEATLNELAERLQIHRSSAQRALERIERLALHPDEGIGRR